MSDYPWNSTQKSIFFIKVKEPPKDAGLEYIHRKIHRLMDIEEPINRLELLERCELELTHFTKQNWNRHVSDYKRLALEADILEVFTPKEFLDENPVENMGVGFSPKGGYSIYNESLIEGENFKTCDEAQQALMEMTGGVVPDTVKLSNGMIFTPDPVLDESDLIKAKQEGIRSIRKPQDNLNHKLEQEAKAMLDNIDIDE